MVMSKNVMQKNLRQSIKKSLGRYIAIIAIIALGAAIFVGLRSTKSDMVATGQVFTDGQNMFDLRILNAYGWTQKDVDAVSQMDGVANAEGAITLDVIGRLGDDGEDSVYKLHSIPQKVNKVYLLGGRMPSAPNECLADGFHVSDSILGKSFVVSEYNDENTLDALNQRSYTVVGYVSTPLYMDMSRGNTSLGNGSITSYLYIPQDAFSVDYFTEMYITVPGDYAIYSPEYNAVLDEAVKRFEQLILPLAEDRLADVKQKAEDAYAEGLIEYEEGLAEFQQAEANTKQELDDALKKLQDGETELEDNRKLLDDTKTMLTDSQKEIDKNRQTLAQTQSDAYKQLADANAELLENYKTVSANLKQVEDALSQINSGLVQIDSGISQLEMGITQTEVLLRVAESTLSVVDYAVEQARSALDYAQQQGATESELEPLRKELEEAIAQRDSYEEQRNALSAAKDQYTAQLQQLRTQKEELSAQSAELTKTKKTLDDALSAIDTGFLELQANQTKVQNEFAAAQSQIEAAQSQLNTALKDLETGEVELEKGAQELAEGWEEYYSGKAEAEEELEKAKNDLADAKHQLDDAKEEIASMTEAEVFVLDRNTNVGYVSLESNSDIVEGVSAVFPAFFLLIAALVCITTMTRMVEEERTQIGTLKALGYSNNAIIGKYLAYAGSAAIIGCGIGVVAGSVVFPLILWQAYKIIIFITPTLVLKLNVPLCVGVVAAYSAVTLFVTWYSCRMSLREVPAELIRPKPPTSGKKIFLEHLPFWDKFSFLNKVMLRNIFRYRQRLLMMLVGIGGCTALLLTGFGIRDSIVDIVSYQFDEITLYDLDVRFSENQSEEQQTAFLEEMDELVDDTVFFHQSSMELDYGDVTKDITFIAAGHDIMDVLDFHSGKNALNMPTDGNALISIGIAEKLGIRIGDTVTLRNADLQKLILTVSGIYDNHVNNYIITTPETVQAQWGALPEIQMAAICIDDEQDVHEVAADVSDFGDVMSVTVNQDMAEQVGGMLQALDLVVLTVVICAGMLAVIVLYNLTNINITERIREIATIKVLGFNAKETALYVFKENLLLSVMGSAAGLIGGIFLLEFVMSKITIDFVWMPARLLPISFVLSVVLTMLSALLVDFVLYYRLDKINMAEALKSVE